MVTEYFTVTLPANETGDVFISVQQLASEFISKLKNAVEPGAVYEVEDGDESVSGVSIGDSGRKTSDYYCRSFRVKKTPVTENHVEYGSETSRDFVFLSKGDLNGKKGVLFGTAPYIGLDSITDGNMTKDGAVHIPSACPIKTMNGGLNEVDKKSFDKIGVDIREGGTYYFKVIYSLNYLMVYGGIYPESETVTKEQIYVCYLSFIRLWCITNLKPSLIRWMSNSSINGINDKKSRISGRMPAKLTKKLIDKQYAYTKIGSYLTVNLSEREPMYATPHIILVPFTHNFHHFTNNPAAAPEPLTHCFFNVTDYADKPNLHLLNTIQPFKVRMGILLD